MRGAYPGTFDPPTIAHIAVAEAARSQCALERVDLIVNREPLGKSTISPLATRIAMLEAVAASRPWMAVVVTDKWSQVLDVAFYSSVAARDDAVSRLPQLAVAPRQGYPLPDDCVVLDVQMSAVSSTAARSGRVDLVPPEVRRLM